MKTGLDLNQLAAEITRQQRSKRDFKAPTAQLEMVPVSNEQPRLRIGSEGMFGMTPLMHDQVGNYLGIPAKYYDRMHEANPGLLATNVNSWMEKKTETRLVRTLDGSARAFLSNRYRCIDNADVAEAVLPVILKGGATLGLRVESSDITDTRLYIKAVSENITAQIAPGRNLRQEKIIVQAGIVISNSEVGLHSFKVEPLIFTLACYNGAIISDAGMRRYHIGRQSEEADNAFEVFTDATRKADDRALMMKMRDVVRAAFDQVRFKQLVGRVQASTNNMIKAAPEKAVDQVVEIFAVQQKHRDGILQHLAAEKDMSQWGLSSAVTAFAQDKSLNYEEATSFERIGGDILTLSDREWAEIAEPVAA